MSSSIECWSSANVSHARSSIFAAGTIPERHRWNHEFLGREVMDTRTNRETLERTTVRNPHSTAQIAGHPIHPMLIPFPVAFFVATFACDIAFLRTGNADWAMATEWLLGAGLVMAALAAVAGLIDFFGEKKIRNLNDAWWHAGGNVTAVLIAAYNFYI